MNCLGACPSLSLRAEEDPQAYLWILARGHIESTRLESGWPVSITATCKTTRTSRRRFTYTGHACRFCLLAFCFVPAPINVETHRHIERSVTRAPSCTSLYRYESSFPCPRRPVVFVCKVITSSPRRRIGDVYTAVGHSSIVVQASRKASTTTSWTMVIFVPSRFQPVING